MGKTLDSVVRGLASLVLAGALSTPGAYGEGLSLTMHSDSDEPGTIILERNSTKILYLEADNDTDIPNPGAGWTTVVPLQYRGHVAAISFGRPSPQTDYFEGKPLFFEAYGQYDDPSNAVLESGNMEPGKRGDLEFYETMTSRFAPLGSFNFNFHYCFSDPDGAFCIEPCCVATDSTDVYVVPERGDANLDGYVNMDDISPFVGSLVAGTENLDPNVRYAMDFNGDGKVDARDIKPLVDKLLAGS